MNLNTIHCGDAVEYLKSLPDNAVNCVVTSPPYYQLRDYGKDGQIGLEGSVGEYLANLRPVFQEVRRVLRNDGVLWLNMGDSYNGYKANTGDSAFTGVRGNHNPESGRGLQDRALPAKNLFGVPWRLAFMLQDDGWILRSDCIWHKPSVMPESVTDRPSKSHEYVFLLSKSPRYWYDARAVREPLAESTLPRAKYAVSAQHKYAQGGHGQHVHSMAKPRENGEGYPMDPSGRNLRTVWTLSAEANPYAHFAAFPKKLARRCILLGCPRQVCVECGAPYVREVDRTPIMTGTPSSNLKQSQLRPNKSGNQYKYGEVGYLAVTTLGFSPTCTCNASTRPGVVLDPFMGSGTTALVARAEGRDFLGCDLNPEYVAMAEKRLAIPYTPRLFYDDEVKG